MLILERVKRYKFSLACEWALPLQVIINKKTYLDRINLTTEYFNEMLNNKKSQITACFE